MNPLHFQMESTAGVVLRHAFIDRYAEEALRRHADTPPLTVYEIDHRQIAQGWLAFQTPTGFTPRRVIFDNGFGARDEVACAPGCLNAP